MDIGVKDGKIVGVRGREVDRINKGRLGPKGMHSWITNHSEDRLKYPVSRTFSFLSGGLGYWADLRGSGQQQIRNEKGELRRATWDEAMDLIVRKTKETLEKLTTHGIGIYTSGQLFLEECESTQLARSHIVVSRESSHLRPSLASDFFSCFAQTTPWPRSER